MRGYKSKIFPQIMEAVYGKDWREDRKEDTLRKKCYEEEMAKKEKPWWKYLEIQDEEN